MMESGTTEDNDAGGASDDAHQPTERGADQSAPSIGEVREERYRTGTASSTNDDQRDADRERSNPVYNAHAVPVLTAVAAFAAIGSMLFSGGQWFEAHQAGKQIDQQISIAKRLAQIAQTQSAAAWVSARASQQQADNARAQIGISQRELALNQESVGVARAQYQAQAEASNRQMRTLQLLIDSLPMNMTIGTPLSATYHVANVGNTPIVVRHAASVFGLYDQPAKDNFDLIRKNLGTVNSFPQSVGQGVALQYSLKTNNPAVEEDQKKFDAGKAAIKLSIEVEYVDAAKHVHHSYACSIVQGAKDSRSQSACPTPLDD